VFGSDQSLIPKGQGNGGGVTQKQAQIESGKKAMCKVWGEGRYNNNKKKVGSWKEREPIPPTFLPRKNSTFHLICRILLLVLWKPKRKNRPMTMGRTKKIGTGNNH